MGWNQPVIATNSIDLTASVYCDCERCDSPPLILFFFSKFSQPPVGHLLSELNMSGQIRQLILCSGQDVRSGGAST